MENIVAVVWDFDKTLVNGYMQAPLFKEYSYDSTKFWNEVIALKQRYEKEQGVRVNGDTIYLNHLINLAQNGTFKCLNNSKLRAYGAQLSFYEGIPELFDLLEHDLQAYEPAARIGLRIEHYIVSTGLAATIRGIPFANKIKAIWGSELVDRDGTIAEIVYAMDNTAKTRTLFEINKGVIEHPERIDVNSKMEPDQRRVPFANIIYLADGPSDVPAFSLVRAQGGKSCACYNPNKEDEYRTVYKLHMENRIDYFTEANYTKNGPAYSWIKQTIISITDRIVAEQDDKMKHLTFGTPGHTN